MIRMSDGTRLIAGAMSGTSGDGVDVAIVRVDGVGLSMKAQLLHHHHVPFDAGIRSALFAIRDTQQFRLSELAKLGREISLTYARAVNESLSAANLHADQLSAVAAHGQTLYHDPPNTIQWFDPSLVAGEVGCPVVSDFRRADCAAGGQGAPLVPFADYILFRDSKSNRALLNIGGIANVTFVPAGAQIDQTVAFDTGPGNCISDFLCRRHEADGPGFDFEGHLARSGKADERVLKEVMRAPYFKLPPPKSTDGPEMIAQFNRAVDTWNRNSATPVYLRDLLAVACRITCTSIMWGLSCSKQPTDEVVVSGGGTKNKFLIELLSSLITGSQSMTLRHAEELGVPGDAKEAIAFALLGAATLDGVPSNLPSVTGARRAVVLGSITPKP
jgi:anhydro-N-acetylmuramic acid kinase